MNYIDVASDFTWFLRAINMIQSHDGPLSRKPFAEGSQVLHCSFISLKSMGIDLL